MKVNINTKNKKKKKKVGSKGFTLVELLAVLAILSLVMTVVIYTATNVIANAKEKSYKVTVNNIEKEASVYVVENASSNSWIIGDTGDFEYQCVTVKNLIDKGFLKGDVLESYVESDRKVQANNYIYLERDRNTKAVTRTMLLYGENTEELRNDFCGGINASGGISFEIEPDNGKWAKSKEVTIYYNLYNNLDKVSNYVYDYTFEQDENIKKEAKFNNRFIEEKTTVYHNGWMYASIEHSDSDSDFSGIVSSFEVTGIDDVRPRIEENYDGDEVVRGSVLIRINVIDNESGVDDNSFTKEDLKVTIGGEEITDIDLNKDTYELTIYDVEHEGEVVIVIYEDLVLDNVGNGNEETILTPNVSFSNKYMISYDGNGGEIVNNETSKIVTHNKAVGELPKATRNGYTFNGWNTKIDGSGTSYDSTTLYLEGNDITLYAQWKANKVIIKYSVNGGTLQPSTTADDGTEYSWTSNVDGIISNNGDVLQYSINYGEETSSNGLANYNNSKYLYITKTGYIAKSGAEWKCLSGCTTSDKTFNHESVYNASDFCDASLGDCTVVVGVNWIVSTYMITYDANGGSGAPNAVTVNAYQNYTLSSTKPTKTAKNTTSDTQTYKCIFLGWNTEADGSGTSYAAGDTYNGSSDVTLYAQWHCHVWNARGLSVFEAAYDMSFNCSVGTHRLFFFVYCTECGMSKQYYRECISSTTEEGNRVTNTLDCPCNSGSGYSVLYDDLAFDYGQAKYHGGIYYVDDEPTLNKVCNDPTNKCKSVASSLSEYDCSEHSGSKRLNKKTAERSMYYSTITQCP